MTAKKLLGFSLAAILLGTLMRQLLLMSLLSFSEQEHGNMITQ